MPLEGLFDMEQYNFLSAPSSSTRLSLAPGLRPVVVCSAAGAAHMPHHSSPASQVARGRSGSVSSIQSKCFLKRIWLVRIEILRLRVSVYFFVLCIMCTNHMLPVVEERLMDVSFPSDIRSSNLFAGTYDPKTSFTTPSSSRSNTASSSFTTFSGSRSSKLSSSSNTSASSKNSNANISVHWNTSLKRANWWWRRHLGRRSICGRWRRHGGSVWGIWRRCWLILSLVLNHLYRLDKIRIHIYDQQNVNL